MLKNIIHAVKSFVHEAAKKNGIGGRSKEWPKIEKAFLKEHPACAACGETSKLQVHHVEPFHLHPEKELDMSNLITLCMGSNKCHILLGHGDSFRMYNPNIRSDAAESLKDPNQRKMLQETAKKNRLGA